MQLKNVIAIASRHVVLCSVPMAVCAYSYAQSSESTVVGDGSTQSAIDRSSDTYRVSGGTLSGLNLFHSFSRFDVPVNTSVEFADSPDRAVQNVVSRITGVLPSTIEGAVRSLVPGANLYLINPNGIAVGPGAAISVDGSFYISSADELRFADGAVLGAGGTPSGTFSSASPEAFGFLDGNSGLVSVGLHPVNGDSLEIPTGEGLSIIAGNVDIQGAEVIGDLGKFEIVAAGSGVEVPLVGSMTRAELPARGDISIGKSRIEVADGGVITIVGGSVEMSNSIIKIDNFDRSGGAIAITAADGNVVLNASSVFSVAMNRAFGGSISLKSNGDVISTAGLISTTSTGAGDAGSISIRGRNVSLHGFTFSSNTNVTGDGGAILVVADEQVSMASRSEIVANTFATGSAGTIQIEADQVRIVEGSQVSASSGPNSGPGGKVEIRSETLVLAGEMSPESGELASVISTRSDGQFDAGDIVIRNSEQVLLLDGGIISTAALSGDGGNISLNADVRIQLENARITTEVRSGEGNGGNINIDPQFVILRDSSISANAFGGNGGNVTIVAGSFLADQDSLVEASSARKIDGVITITAPDSDLSSELVVLSSDFVDVASRLAPRCAREDREALGSFASSGRTGIPEGPGGFLASYGETSLPVSETGETDVTADFSWEGVAVYVQDCSY